MDDRPVVVVIRHPDRANEYTVFPSPTAVHVIDIDLGGTISPDAYNTWPEIRDWKEIVEEQIVLLPTGHPARVMVQEQIEYVLNEFDYESPDEGYEDGAI